MGMPDTSNGGRGGGRQQPQPSSSGGGAAQSSSFPARPTLLNHFTPAPTTDDPNDPYNNNYYNTNNNGHDDEETWGETFTKYDDPAVNYLQQQATKLRALCEAASGEDNIDDESAWEAVREWIIKNRRGGGQSFLVAAAERRGDYDTTPLHLACSKRCPIDIVQSLIDISPRTVHMTDTFDWLPVHYACANGAKVEILRALADADPSTLSVSDKRGRTPLHFALGNARCPADATVVSLLSRTGAAACRDENGMLPLHYACAYGISPDSLRALTDANPDSISATDKKGRTPIHFAMGNADRPSSPSVVEHLLAREPDLVNITNNDGQLALHILSTQAGRLQPDAKEGRSNARRCLELYLDANPRGSSDFFTALQNLPTYLRDVAVVTRPVQNVLNIKISNRFPSMILMLDFYCILAILLCFYPAVGEMIQLLSKGEGTATTTAAFNDTSDSAVAATNDSTSAVNLTMHSVSPGYLFTLYFGGTYFLMREVVQMISLATLGVFKTYLSDPTNLLDLCCIFMVLFWAFVMTAGTFPASVHAFSRATAASTGVLWCLLLTFLRSTVIDFAVFVGGVFYVLKKLSAFLMALAVILVAFAQMFVIVFHGTGGCPATMNASVTNGSDGVVGEEALTEDGPFCSFWSALLKVYTMLLGEVDEQDFSHSTAATVLFVIFVFLVSILLANVLIAIVTDSFGVIKNQRAQIVFWSNRLDFVAEIDFISAFVHRLRNFFCCRSGKPEERALYATKKIKARKAIQRSAGGSVEWGDVENGEDDVTVLAKDTFGQETWHVLWALYDDQGLDVLSVEFYCYMLSRAAGLVVIPLWLLVGFLCFGLLWPPQVREWLLVQSTTRVHLDPETDYNHNLLHQKEHRRNNASEVTELRKELSRLREDTTTIVREMKAQRQQQKQQRQGHGQRNGRRAAAGEQNRGKKAGGSVEV